MLTVITVVHAPRPAALAALQQRAPGARQACEPGALGRQVAGVVDRERRHGCAAQPDRHGQGHEALRLPHIDGLAATCRQRRRPATARRDGVRPELRQAQIARRLGRPAEAGPVTRRARASRPSRARPAVRGRMAGAGWAATGTAAAAATRITPEAIHHLVRRQTRPVRATTVTPYPASASVWAIFQTRESFWNGLLTMSAVVRTGRPLDTVMP